MPIPRLLVLGAGILLGILVGYGVWGYDNRELRREVAKTKAWLLDEIQRSDARSDARQQQQHEAPLRAAQEALARSRAELAKAKDDLAQTQAVLKEAVGDWRAERQRRRALEQELAGTFRAPPAAVRSGDKE